MINKICITMFALLFGTAVKAETVSIRSGEHADFSRLVLDVSTDFDWAVETSGVGFSVQISAATLFETDQVFDRIPRTRIQGFEIGENGTTLRIVSDCDCSIDAFEWQRTKLVVDIRDNPIPDERANLREEAGDTTQVALPIVTEQRPLQRPEIPPIFEDVKDTKDQLASLEQVILQSLARGATQGLLEPKLVRNENPDLHFDRHLLQNQPGVLVHTSIDRTPVEKVDLRNPVCLQDAFFDLPSWGDDAGFAVHIGRLRRHAVAEFDALDPEKVVELAKAYLYYGFGREAKNTLLTDSVNSAERAVLIELAAIIDSDPISGNLIDQVYCDGPGALWAFLSDAKLQEGSENRNSILRTFRALPTHLQRHLGAALSERFVNLGDVAGAELSLAANMVEPEPSFEAEIAQTDIFLEEGNVEAAVARLENLAAENSQMTPEALIELFEIAIETGRNVQPQTFELADIFRFELRGENLANDLLEVQVKALILNGKVARAFDVLSEGSEGLEFRKTQDLSALAILAAAEKYDDFDFLRLAFDYPFKEISPVAQNVVATRLIALGFFDQSAEILADAAVGEAMAERRYLRAETELGRGEGDRALVHLLGLVSQRAQDLRSRAELMANGRDVLELAGLGNDWRSGNWDSMLQGDDPLLKTASEFALQDEAIDLTTSRPLAQGRELLSQTSRTRSLISDLMARFDVVED